MKSPILLVIAAALSSSPFALAEHGVDPNQIRLLSNKLHPGDLLKNGQEAHVSEQCLREVQDLGDNSNLLAALAATDECPLTHKDNTFEINFASCPAGDRYKIACTAAGGKSAIIPTIRVVCKLNENEVEIIFSNAIECLGQSCPETLLDIATLRELENGAEALTRASCTASSSTSVSLNAVVMASGVFFFLATLL